MKTFKKRKIIQRYVELKCDNCKIKEEFLGTKNDIPSISYNGWYIDVLDLCPICVLPYIKEVRKSDKKFITKPIMIDCTSEFKIKMLKLKKELNEKNHKKKIL